MTEQEFMEVLNDCIQRLANGQSIEDCLRAYPAYAARLRSLLEAGVIVGQISFPMAEVLEDQERTWRDLQQRLQGKPARSQPLRLRLILGIAAVLVLMIGTAIAAYSRITQPSEELIATLTPTATVTVTSQPTNIDTPTLTPTPTAVTATANASESPAPSNTSTLTPTSTSTLTATLTSTSTYTATAMVTNTPQPTRTASATYTRTATATSTRTPAPQLISVIIQGPIGAIDNNVLTIYGLEVYVPIDNLVLPNLRVGDMVYVEGYYEGDTIIAVIITPVGTATPTSSNVRPPRATGTITPVGNSNANSNDNGSGDNNGNSNDNLDNSNDNTIDDSGMGTG